MDDTRANSNPTPEEIRRECLRIQSGWDARTERIRYWEAHSLTLGQSLYRETITVQVVASADLPLAPDWT
jgi:hypothetical protein